MTKEQILEWLDKNNRGFTQKDFELFKKFYEEATKELQELYKKADESWWNAQQIIKKQQEQIERMNELINRYYMVCAEIPKELRTMVFDSCMEDTEKMVKDKEIKK